MPSYAIALNLEGTAEGDIIRTGLRNDILFGGPSNDELTGGGGNDQLRGDAGLDKLDGGDGTDTASYSISSAAVTVNLGTGSTTGGDAQGDTFISIENLTGSQFDDTLTGNGGDNNLQGGAGGDTLTGGPGADMFVLSSGNDVITDFDPGSGDRIQIPQGTTMQTVFTQVGGDGNNTVLTHAGGTLTLADPATQNLLVSIDESWFAAASTGNNEPPQIVRSETFHEGELVYFRLHYTDSDNDAVGFGFRGINGSGWGSEEYFFTHPSYGRVSPGQVEYPFNHLCGTGSAYESDVAAYIFDAEGNRSSEVEIHLACSPPNELNLSVMPEGEWPCTSLS
jgi:hypothetical protein